MNPTRSFVAVACMAVVSACSTVTAPAQSGFLSSYSEFSRDPNGSAHLRSTEVIDPTRVRIGDIEWRAPADADVSRDEQDFLLRQLSDELAARVRDLPPAPQGRPAVLRAAITRVETVDAPRSVSGINVPVEFADMATASRESIRRRQKGYCRSTVSGRKVRSASDECLHRGQRARDCVPWPSFDDPEPAPAIPVVVFVSGQSRPTD